MRMLFSLEKVKLHLSQLKNNLTLVVEILVYNIKNVSLNILKNIKITIYPLLFTQRGNGVYISKYKFYLNHHHWIKNPSLRISTYYSGSPC